VKSEPRFPKKPGLCLSLKAFTVMANMMEPFFEPGAILLSMRVVGVICSFSG